MMTDTSPRHSVKARRKQKGDNDQQHSDPSNIVDDNDDPDAWRRKYEAAVRKRRSPVASPGPTCGAGGLSGNLSPSSPLSVKSSAANSTTLSQADMDFILATSMDTMDRMDGSERMHPPVIGHTNSNYSADSIIRRVEAEIAAARKSAAMAHSNNQNRFFNHNINDEEDDDMAQILNTNNTFTDQQHNAASVGSSTDSSKHRALDLIRDEFREDFTQKGVDLYIDRPAGLLQTESMTPLNNSTSSQIYFTNEDWQDEHNDPRQTDTHVDADDICHPTEEKKEDKPNSPAAARMMRRSTNLKDGRKNHPDQNAQQSVPASSTSPGSKITISTDDGVEAPIRSPNYTGPSNLKLEPLKTSQHSSNSNNDPEGDYQETPTPPRKQSTTSTSSLHNQRSTNSALSPPASVKNFPSPSTQTSQRAMNKTKELLETLKEQRHAIPSPSAEIKNNPKPSLRPPPISPRSSNFLPNRATNGTKVHTRPIPSPLSISQNRLRETTSSKISDRNVIRPPPSSPLFPTSLRNNSKRDIFPEEVYEIVNANESGKINGATDLNSVSSEQSRRIRFRNPFPILKPPIVRRDLEDIIRDHEIRVPDNPIRWVKPKQELKQLIVAAMGTSLPRRSNACGALKVLTRHEKNQISLVRTDGFLQALTYAASQSVLDVDTDLAIDARTRAVACLKNVCAPKDNRIVILNHPGVVECLIKVVQQDDGAGRAIAAAAIALLAKTPQCRECLVQVEGLIDTLAKVMQSAATLISDEAMAVRKSFSPRSGGNDRTVNSFNDNGIPNDASVQSNNELIHRHESASIITESSSLSSVDDDGQNTIKPDNAISTSKIVEVRTVDSIKNQTEERHDEFVNQARCNSCAALLHISKQCATSHQLATNPIFLSSVATVAREMDHPIHSKCLDILCNISRLQVNNSILTRFDGIIGTLVSAAMSSKAENRIAALRTLQNMSADPSSKTVLATSQVLNLMTSCAMRKDMDEKDIAVATLYNITTEPGAVTAITNTKNVVATLVHLAHSPDSSSDVRLLACEALATISLWLQTLAGTGKVPDGIVNAPLPSQKTSGWERWD